MIWEVYEDVQVGFTRSKLIDVENFSSQKFLLGGSHYHYTKMDSDLRKVRSVYACYKGQYCRDR